MKFKDMKVGDVVEFYALLEDLKLRYTPNQTSYYSANLSDGNTVVDARIWDIHLKQRFASEVIPSCSLIDNNEDI